MLLLATWLRSTVSTRPCEGPASRHGSSNFLFQVALCLPSKLEYDHLELSTGVRLCGVRLFGAVEFRLHDYVVLLKSEYDYLVLLNIVFQMGTTLRTTRRTQRIWTTKRWTTSPRTAPTLLWSPIPTSNPGSRAPQGV